MNRKFRIISALLVFSLLFLILYFGNIFLHRSILVSRQHSIDNINTANYYIEQIYSHNIQHNHFDSAKYTWNKEIFSKNNFRYDTAFVLLAFLKINFDNYLPQNFYNEILTFSGKVSTNRNPDNKFSEGELDSVFVYYPLYFLPKDSKFSLAMEDAYKQLSKQEVLIQCGNNYVHKLNNKNWETYKFSLDGLFMALPFLLKHDKNEKEIFNRMNWVSKNMRLENGLYSHGAKANGTPNNIVWLRGAGWYAINQVELLSMIKNKNYKKEMVKQLVQFFDGMLKYQDFKTGMWKNVIYPKVKNCNYFESSGNLMIAYALIEAYSKGYVTDKKYLNAGIRAYNGVMDNNFIKNNKHGILKNIYLFSNVKNKAQDYCNCSLYVNDDAKGLAPLILSTNALNNVLKTE